MYKLRDKSRKARLRRATLHLLIGCLLLCLFGLYSRENSYTGRGIPLKISFAEQNIAPVAENSIGSSGSEGEWGFSEELSGVMDSFYELIGDQGDESIAIEELGIESVLGSLLEMLQGGVGDTGGFLIMLFGISLIFLSCETLKDGMGENGGFVLSAIGASLSLPVVAWLSGVISGVKSGLASATELFSGLIPIFTAISSIGGGNATAVAEGAGMSISLGVVSAVITRGLLPLVMLSFALGMVASFDTGGSIAPLIRGLRSFFMLTLGGVTTLLVGTLALQTVITNAKDTLALRGVKYAVSGMIPMVGGSVSSALGALVSGVSLARGTVGVGALASLLALLGAPLIQLLLFRLAFRICISFLELTGGGFGARVLSGIQSALDGLISILASSAVIFILEVVIFMRLGAPGV